MKNRSIIVRALGIVLIAAIGFASCSKPADNNGQKIQRVDVQVKILKPTKLVDALQVPGIVKAFEEANISPVEGGIVKAWKKKKGQQVKKGDLIVVLEDDMLRSGYNAASAQYKMAELNLQKQKAVYDEQGISELQYKNLQYARDAAKANADLMKARWEHTQIKSPIDGILDNTVPNEGELAAPGMPLARVVNTTKIKIQAEVPERNSTEIKLGASSISTFDAVPGDTVSGMVTFVGSTVSAVNHTVMVEIILTNPNGKLKSDMIAKTKLLREAKNNAILISEDMIQLVDRDRLIVFVDHNGTAQERRLTLGGRQGNRVEVVSGLRAGDRLIVVGYQKLVDGTPINVIQ